MTQLDDNKAFKNRIKKHELKQVCAYPIGQTIIRIYVTTDAAADPEYFKSNWYLDDEDKLHVTNWSLSLNEAQDLIEKVYPKEVRDLRLLDAWYHIQCSRDVAAGLSARHTTMDERKWHKLRADVMQFMLKDCRVPEEK